MAKPKIAVFAGATATVLNSAPLVTSNAARRKYGLPLMTGPDGSVLPYDVLRPQRLAAPVTVYIEQFSAHPLEKDAAELYAPPDGYVDRFGNFHKEPTSPDDVPVYEVTLRPEDGLYPLPYMARQANGQPWETYGVDADAPAHLTRQTFYPDASRLFEEIDRLGVGEDGRGCLLSSKADFDFYRVIPPGGYRRGLPAKQRTDVGDGDIPPEEPGVDFFPYVPRHLRREPPLQRAADAVNAVQKAMSSGRYAGGLWLEGSPYLEETVYWLQLLVDTELPLVGVAAQRPHGTLGNDGDWNIVDAVNFLVSRLWDDGSGRNALGVVVIQDQQIFAAREVQKADARPGGYVAAGGHGGIVGTMGHPGPAAITFRPACRHTYNSALKLSALPETVEGVTYRDGKISPVPVQVKDESGFLRGDALPKVTIAKHARYLPDDSSADPDREVEIMARLEYNLRHYPLSGFVAEGAAPYGNMSDGVTAALQQAVYSGLPVVHVGRGNAEGMAPRWRHLPFIAGRNLTATKARILLMACLLKLGALPPARDPRNPTPEERRRTEEKIAEYQQLFDTH